MKKLAIAASSVALAAMPMVGVFADPAADQIATDTISIQVKDACSFTAGDADRTYSVANATNGTPVSPTNTDGPGNVHSFTVFCNKNSGYTVSSTAANLTASNISDVFAYATSLPNAQSEAAAKADGKWNATIAAGAGLTDQEISQITAAATAATIVNHGAASVADGETFTSTYTAWVGTETPAGTYSGTISYTLAPAS